MSRKDKEFEQFLREARGVPRNVTQQIADNRYGGQTQTFRAEKSPEEEDAYQKARQAFELQLARQEATTDVVDLKDKDGNILKDSRNRNRKTRVAAETEGLTPEEEKRFGVVGFVPSAGQVEQAFERSRQASAAMDETSRQNKKISPSYWVTQADFNQAFGRNYNPMSREDQRDFFQLVQNAPGATRRTDVAGADVGAVVPSRQRPSSLPTFQDVDGIKVPETAFGYTEKQQKQAQDLGFKTVQDYEQAKEMTGAYSEKPDFVVQREAEKLAKLQPISDKLIKDLSLLGYGKKRRGPSPYSERQKNPLEDPRKALKFVQQYAPETLTPEQKRSLGVYNPDLPYSRRGAGANYLPPNTFVSEPEPAPAPDPAPPPELPPLSPAPESGKAGTFPAPPISVASTIGLYGGQPTTTLQTPELLRRPTKETSEKPRKTNQIPDLLRAPPKEPKKGEYPPWFMRMQNQPLPPSPPVEGLPYDRTKPLERSENLPERPPSDWWKQSVTARPPGISQEFSPTDLSGVGLYGGVLGQMRFARGQRPSRQEVGVMGPSRSEAELSKMMRDAREAPSSVGPSMYPGIPASVASLIASYAPEPAPAPDPEPAPLPTPKLSAGEDGLPQFPDQFSRWYPPTVGPRQTPSQREPQIGRLEPVIEFEPAPAPEPPPASYAIAGVDVEGPPKSEAERSKMMRDAKESEPSGLQQAMRLAQGAGEFGRNLDQAAGRKVREVGQKIGEIAKSMGEKSKTARSRIAVPGVDVEGPSRSEAGLSRLMRDARESEFAPAPDPAPAPLPTSSLSTPKTPISKFPDEYAKWYPPILGPVEMGQQGPEFDEIEQPTQNFNLTPEGPVTVQIYDRKSGREKAIRRMIGMDPIGQLEYERTPRFVSPSGEEHIAPGSVRTNSALPKEVKDLLDKLKDEKFNTQSPITKNMASRILQVQTPGQAPIQTPISSMPLTPQTAAEYINSIAREMKPIGAEGIRQRITPKTSPMSFTEGMSEAEVDQEFERIFGKPTSQRLSGISLNAKRDMIGRYKLKETGE